MASYREITSCRGCGNTDLETILELGRQALTGVFPKSRSEKVTAGPVDLVKCVEKKGQDRCGLLQLRQSYDKAEMYGSGYGYHSGLNQSMVDHLAAKVKEILAVVTLSPDDLVIDIGSNDATLLKAYPDLGCKLVGIDPTGAKFRKYYPERVRLIPDFFSARAVEQAFGAQKAKIVTSIAMFYDLDSPLDFMREVGSVLADDGVWVLEQSHMPTMLEQTAYDTVCHEHLEYYGLRQLAWLAARAGFKILDAKPNAVNGGSLALILAKEGSAYRPQAARVQALLEKEKSLSGMKPYAAFAKRVARHKEELLAFLSGARKKKKTVLGYGASTKGNVILQYCGLSEKEIPFIGEVNEEKFGRFTPGSLIPIIPEQEAKKLKPDYLMVLPWHFKDFIVKKEAKYLQSGGKLFFPLPRLEIR